MPNTRLHKSQSSCPDNNKNSTGTIAFNKMWALLIIVVFVVIIIKITRMLIMGRVKSNTCLVGKTAIVTGGNMGLGYYTSLALASRGCRVIIACRSNAQNVKDDIIRYTRNSNIVVKHLDLSSFASVREFAKEINENEDRLDILINNAGINSSRQSTNEDWDMVMQVNHYGPFLLTHLLADLLKKSAPSRIVFVSSTMALFHMPTIKQLYQKSDPHSSYPMSKLCNIVSAKLFAKKLKQYGVTSNAIHPGMANTGMIDKTDMGPMINFFTKYIFFYIMYFFFKTAEEGAQTQVHVAVSGKLQNVTGKFFMNCRRFFLPIRARDDVFCEEVWKLSEKRVNLKPEEKL